MVGNTDIYVHCMKNAFLNNDRRLKNSILFILAVAILLFSAAGGTASADDGNAPGTSSDLPPTFQVQDQNIDEGQLLTFAVSAIDPEGDNIVYGIMGLPQGASFTDGSGQNAGKKVFSWTPGHSDAGAYPVSFSAADGTSVVYSNITITVVNANREPVLAVIGPRSVSENSLLTFTLSAIDTDNNTLTFSSPSLPKNADINTVSGVFQWTPAYDQSGIYQVEFVVSDGKGQDSEYVTITVNNANRPPVFSPVSDPVVNENTLLEITFTASDPDSDVLAFSKNVPFGTISGNKFSWRPSYDNAGEHSIEFTVSDGDKKETQTAKVNVVNINRQPTLYSIPDVSSRENEQITIQLAAYDPDGDILTYSNVNKLPDGAELNTATGLFRWTPTTTDYRYIEFIVSDGVLNSDSKRVTIAVGAPAFTPEIAAVPGQKVNENEELSFTVTASDSDNDLLSYSMDYYPDGARLESTTGLFTWTPGYDDAGKHTIEFRAYERRGNYLFSDYRTVTIEVVNINRAPEISYIPARFISETQALQIPITATDHDGDALTFKTNKSSGTIRGNTFMWTPGYSDYGTHYVQFTASDGLSTASTTATIIVDNTNMPPKLDAIGVKAATIGKMLEFTVDPSDGDGDQLVLSASGLPSGASFDTSSGVFRWTPSASQKGTYSVSFKVSDGKLSDYQTIAVTVKEPSGSGSSGGGGSGGGGSGGSSSGSRESYENVEFKDYSIRYVMKDRETIYSFTKENSIITNVSLTTRLNGGQTKTVVESLKGTSTLVRKEAPGKVYRNVNIWVGDEKFSPESISDASVEFRVEKEWIQASNVDAVSIELLRYADGAWEQLSTSGTGEDGTYVYYTANVPEFSVFAISSVDESAFAEDGEENASQLNDDENSTMSLDDAIDPAGSTSATQERRSSGIVYIAIIGLTALGIVSYRYRVSLGKTIAQLGNPDGKRYRRFKR